jgi:adenosylhomocysteine nucleosidase
MPYIARMSIALVTPLHEEHDLFAEALHKRGITHETSMIGRLPARVYPALGLMLVRGGHGKTQFGIHTQHVLDHRGPFEAVICAGAGGAIAPGVEVGDLVLGSTTVEHDYVLRFVKRPLPRFDGDAALTTALRAAHPADSAFTTRIDVIASGDEDVIERTRAEDIRERTGAVIVAWEGVGGARACKFSGMPFVELRGATDNADHTAPGDFETNLALVMDHMAALICAWRGVQTRA